MPRLTSKGQVTIPMAIRDQLGLAPGTEVEFEVEGDTVVLRKQAGGPSRGQRLVERLRGSGTANLDLTTDEIMALTRGDD
jgi:antitoxin PrlF